MDLDKYIDIQRKEAGEWEGGWADQMVDALLKSVSNLPKDSKILDIGCNFGRSLFELDKNGYKNCYGIDIVPENTLAARKIGLNALTMNMEDLSMFSDKYFDFAFMSHAIEHSLDPRKAILEMMRVSKSGLIICPIEESRKILVDSPHTSPFYSENEWINLFDKTNIIQINARHECKTRLGKEVWTYY